MADRCTDPTCREHWPAWVNIPEMRAALAAVWEGDPDPAELTDAEVISHHRAEFSPDE